MYNKGVITYHTNLKYVTGVLPLMPSKKQSIDILIYFEGFPTVFEVSEKNDGASNSKVNMIEIT